MPGSYEQRPSGAPDISCVWRAEADEAVGFVDVASEYWAISFIRRASGELAASLSGPTLEARADESVPGEEYWGVELEAHVVLPGVDKRTLGGGFVDVPVQDGRVRLGEGWHPVPEYDGLEDFVAGLLAAGALRADPDVRRALCGDEDGYSRRSWQRRVRETTGLTRKQVARLQQARHAFALLQEGLAPAEVAVAAGFADQPHLTRSLKLIRGETPARILAAHAA